MNIFIQKLDELHPNKVFWWCILSAALLAGWMQYIQHGWINPDSVLYLEQARLIAQGEWRKAYDIFNWPFYGACIAAVHMLTNVSVHLSAQILNLIFFALSIAAFLRIICLSGGSIKTMLACVLLVFGSQYIVGDVLEMLMRDEGFWASYLFAVFFFMRFYLQQKILDAFYWQICITLATLFRIEAILYALFLPAIWLVRNDLSYSLRLKLIFRSYSLGVFAGVAIIGFLFINPEIHIQDLGRLREVFTPHLFQEFTQKLFTQAHIMSNQVLGEYLEEFAISGLLLTFIGVIIAKILTSTGIIATVLAILGIKHRAYLFPKHILTVLLALSTIALLSMGLIIVKVFVLSSRYIVALVWILLIFAGFYWTHLLKKKSKLWLHAILTVILISGLVKNILPKRDGYNYQQNAVAWIKTYNNRNLPVYYDQSRMRYYAKAPFIGSFHENFAHTELAVINNKINGYHYLLIESSNKTNKTQNTANKMFPAYLMIKRFCDAKKKKCIDVYERSK